MDSPVNNFILKRKVSHFPHFLQDFVLARVLNDAIKATIKSVIDAIKATVSHPNKHFQI